MKILNLKAIAAYSLSAVLAFGAFFVPSIAAASPTGIAAITAAVDFADVLTGVATVAGILAGVYVLIRGARIVLGFVRR